MEAPVTLISPPRDLAVLANNEEARVQNWYRVFGTDGCLLRCQELAQLQLLEKTIPHGAGLSRAARNRKLRETRASLVESRSGRWFSSTKLTTSAENRCGSCAVLGQILNVVFAGEEDGSERVVYSISDKFVCSVGRASDPEATAQPVPLFQPPGEYDHLSAKSELY